MAPYSVNACVFQSDNKVYFSEIERAIYAVPSNACASWDKDNDAYVLAMASEDVLGTLRFVADSAESFIVAFGRDSGKAWCDIITNLKKDQTAASTQPQFYDTNYPERVSARTSHQTSATITDTVGRSFTVKYNGAGDDLTAQITIGVLTTPGKSSKAEIRDILKDIE